MSLTFHLQNGKNFEFSSKDEFESKLFQYLSNKYSILGNIVSLELHFTAPKELPPYVRQSIIDVVKKKDTTTFVSAPDGFFTPKQQQELDNVLIKNKLRLEASQDSAALTFLAAVAGNQFGYNLGFTSLLAIGLIFIPKHIRIIYKEACAEKYPLTPANPDDHEAFEAGKQSLSWPSYLYQSFRAKSISNPRAFAAGLRHAEQDQALEEIRCRRTRMN